MQERKKKCGLKEITLPTTPIPCNTSHPFFLRLALSPRRALCIPALSSHHSLHIKFVQKSSNPFSPRKIESDPSPPVDREDSLHSSSVVKRFGQESFQDMSTPLMITSRASLRSSILLISSLSLGLRGLASMPRSAEMLVALFLTSWTGVGSC